MRKKQSVTDNCPEAKIPCCCLSPKNGYDNHRFRTIICEAQALLKQHAAKNVSIAQLSALYQLSERHFCRVFKKHTGLTPYQYYLQFRICRAKEMLWDTTLSVKEIAASLQFENSCHFSKLFKKKTGMLPTQWRHSTPGTK